MTTTNGKPKRQQIKLDDLVIDEKYQMRCEDMDPSEYQELLQDAEGESWPFDTPIKVAEVGKKKVLIGGFTRVAAAKRAGRKKVPAMVHEHITPKKAIQMAVGENADHGYRRTRADTRKAIFTALKEFPRAKNSDIAQLCRVSIRTIQRAQQSLKEMNGTAVQEVESGDESKEEAVPFEDAEWEEQEPPADEAPDQERRRKAKAMVKEFAVMQRGVMDLADETPKDVKTAFRVVHEYLSQVAK